MLKNKSQLEFSLGSKVYHFICDQDSPLNDIKDALCSFLKYVGNVEDAVKAMQSSATSESPTPESITSVEAPKV